MVENSFRTEHDLIGEVELPAEVLHGIHTARAVENFPLAWRPVHPELVRAYGEVKLACALTNRALGAWAEDPAKADAIERACREMGEGLLTSMCRGPLQGGAGTSTNMNVNEVLANRALEMLGAEHGEYDRVSPLDDINLHQSTNDTYPTALRLAAIRLLHDTGGDASWRLQEAFQAAEKRFAHVVKVGRTEMQDAVLTTLGARWARTPRRSTATAGAFTNARSACAW